MTSFYLIEVKSLGAVTNKGCRIKLTYLHYPADNLTIYFDKSFLVNVGIKEEVAKFLKIAGIRVKGYGFDEKRKVFIFVVDNYERLREMKHLAKGLGASDHKYYNKAESWERAYLPKRKTVRTYKKK